MQDYEKVTDSEYTNFKSLAREICGSVLAYRHRCNFFPHTFNSAQATYGSSISQRRTSFYNSYKMLPSTLKYRKRVMSGYLDDSTFANAPLNIATGL